MTQQTLTNIGSIRTYNGKLYICHRSGELFENGILILQKVESQSFWLKDEWIYFHDLSGSHCFYNRNTQATFRGNIGIAWFSIEGTQAFCNFDVDWVTLKWNSGLLDIEKQEIVQELSNAANKSLIGITEGYYLLADGRQGILAISKQSAKTAWTFSLGALGRWYHDFDKKWIEGELYHIIDVVDDLLWADVSKGVIVGIDIHTGQLRHQLQTPRQMNEAPGYAYWELPIYFHTAYEAATHKLIGMYDDRYWEVDLHQSQPTLAMWVMRDEFSRYDIGLGNADRWTFSADHLYFLDSHGRKLGVVNRQSLKLEWVHAFTNTSHRGALMRIEVNGDKLYVLDSGGTLHIFERE